jgi:hypothetical protein
MTPSSDTSLFGGKELDAVGEPVAAITLDSNVVLLVGQRREHEFRIENDITVGDGTVLTVAPEDKYEAWTYTFGNFILSCPPGGFDPLPR